jgi:hypothetical protein
VLIFYCHKAKMLRATMHRSKAIAKAVSAKSALGCAPASASSALKYRNFGTHKEADPTELIKDIVHSAVTLAGEVS